MEEEYEIGSGNVFADLGCKNPDEAMAKSNLAKQITEIIQHKNMTQIEAAKLLGIDQPKVSDIIRGNLARYSIDRLMRFIRILGHDIEIRVRRSKHSSRPRLNVVNDTPKAKVRRKPKKAHS